MEADRDEDEGEGRGCVGCCAACLVPRAAVSSLLPSARLPPVGFARAGAGAASSPVLVVGGGRWLSRDAPAEFPVLLLEQTGSPD